MAAGARPTTAKGLAEICAIVGYVRRRPACEIVVDALRADLEADGVEFAGDTDSEVAVQLMARPIDRSQSLPRWFCHVTRSAVRTDVRSITATVTWRRVPSIISVAQGIRRCVHASETELMENRSDPAALPTNNNNQFR